MKHVQFEMNLPSPTSSKVQEAKQLYEGEIEVFVRKAYGKTRYYPMNALAHLLAMIANSKCLSVEQLILCKEYGFLIKVENEKKEVPPCEFNMVMDAIEKAMEKKQ